MIAVSGLPGANKLALRRHSPRLDGLSGFWSIFCCFDLSSKQIQVLAEPAVGTDIRL